MKKTMGFKPKREYDEWGWYEETTPIPKDVWDNLLTGKSNGGLKDGRVVFSPVWRVSESVVHYDGSNYTLRQKELPYCEQKEDLHVHSSGESDKKGALGGTGDSTDDLYRLKWLLEEGREQPSTRCWRS